MLGNPVKPAVLLPQKAASDNPLDRDNQQERPEERENSCEQKSVIILLVLPTVKEVSISPLDRGRTTENRGKSLCLLTSPRKIK